MYIEKLQFIYVQGMWIKTSVASHVQIMWRKASASSHDHCSLFRACTENRQFQVMFRACGVKRLSFESCSVQGIPLGFMIQSPQWKNRKF